MVNPNDNQAQNTSTEGKVSDKELNFRALQQSYEKKLTEERQARLDLEQRLKQTSEVDDNDNEPYVDHKRLEKKLAKQNLNTQSEIQRAMEQAKNAAKEELRQESWLENNPDFYDTLKLADKFAERNPRLADTILKMPEGFDRQKLVYQNIKALGLDKPDVKTPSIQDKIDANKRSPYYQPSGVGTAPYSSQGDFSATGQKQAYDKLQELKRNLRI